MDNNNNQENTNSEKNQKDIIIMQKKPLPNLLIPKKTWNMVKDKSQSSQNIFNQSKYSQSINQPIRIKSNKDKNSINRNNISENHFFRTNGTGFNKFNYKIKNFSKCQSFIDNDFSKRSYKIIKLQYNKKTAYFGLHFCVLKSYVPLR